MKKILCLVICCVEILSLLFFSGCRKHTYPFPQDHSEIVSVQIVSLNYGRSQYLEEIFISDVENIPEFLSDFAELNLELIYPPYDSSGMATPTAIKITYRDGEYKYIYPIGSMGFRPDGVRTASGVNTFDQQEFANFLKKYIDSGPVKLEYAFIHPETYITSVEVVRVGVAERSWRVQNDQTTICVIEDIPDFLNRFSQIDCYLNKEKNTRVKDNSVVFKICYDDVAYELVGVDGQSRVYGVDNEVPFEGYRYFDEKQFSELIEFYIGNE